MSTIILKREEKNDMADTGPNLYSNTDPGEWIEENGRRIWVPKEPGVSAKPHVDSATGQNYWSNDEPGTWTGKKYHKGGPVVTRNRDHKGR
jgi:hypothetical protein